MTCCTSLIQRNCRSLRGSQLQRTSWTACLRLPEWRVRRPARHCWTPSTATSQTCYKEDADERRGVRNARMSMTGMNENLHRQNARMVVWSGSVWSHDSSRSYLWLTSIFTGTNLQLQLLSCVCTLLLHPPSLIQGQPSLLLKHSAGAIVSHKLGLVWGDVGGETSTSRFANLRKSTFRTG